MKCSERCGTRLGRRFAVIAGAALAVLACGTGGSTVRIYPDGPLPTTERPVGPALTAAMASQNGSSVTGSATLTPYQNEERTQAHVVISGAPGAGLMPWHVHAGGCGAAAGVLGSGTPYPLIVVDAQGNGSATIVLPFAVPQGGPFSVDVHRSRADETVVACGELRR